MNNVRFAVRQLAARPALTAIIVLTLAFGIGANAAMFSLFHRILIEPLPVPEPDALVNFSSPGPKQGSVSCSQAGGCDYVFSYPMLKDLEREQTVFTGVAAHRGFGANISVDGRAEGGAGLTVSGDYFSVLQLVPALGRLLGPHDNQQVGEGRVAVLSHDYWQNSMGGDPAVLGDTIIVNGQALEIVGVAPEGFNGTTIGQRPRVYVPMTMRWLMEPYFPQGADDRRAYFAYLFARLRPGISVEAAENAINVPYRAILNEVEAPLVNMSAETLAQFRDKRLVLEPGRRGQSNVPNQTQLPLAMLLGVTVLVLMIACVNIANLLLARGAARAGEMAVRASIGASRWQMMRQLLTEAALLATLGLAASVPVAVGTLRVIASIMPEQSAVSVPSALSGTALGVSVLVTLATVLVFGLLPALHATRVAPGAVLKGQSGQSGAGRGATRFRTVLVTAQVAFSMVLLVLAGLFTQSLANISRVDLGMQVEEVATFGIAPVLSGYDAERSRALFDRVEEELAALPGVVSVASAMVGVVAGDSWGGNVSVEGFEAPPDTDVNAQYNEVGPGFFRTLQIPLLSGRDFTDSDRVGGVRVAIVNESFARKFGLDTDAVGKRMAVGSGGELDIEIVGVVQDAKYSGVKDEVPPQYFLARKQNAGLGFMNFYVRTHSDPAGVLAAIPRVVAGLDPNMPVADIATMPTVVRDGVFLDRLISMLSGGFALLATLLAATGLYGVLSYSVTQRTRELGLRQALGAAPRSLLALVLRQVGAMALAGGAVGLVAAAALGRMAESVLFGLSGYDPAVLSMAVVVLGTVVFGAGYLPARRASRISPMEALRYE